MAAAAVAVAVVVVSVAAAAAAAAFLDAADADNRLFLPRLSLHRHDRPHHCDLECAVAAVVVAAHASVDQVFARQRP